MLREILIQVFEGTCIEIFITGSFTEERVGGNLNIQHGEEWINTMLYNAMQQLEAISYINIH